MRHSKTLASLLVGMGWTAIIGGVALIPSGLAIVLIALGGVFVIAGVVVWRRGEPDSPSASLDRLRDVLAGVDRVRIWLSLMEEPDKKLPLDQDRVFQWAKTTFKLIQTKFPEHADEFMGGHLARVGSAYFATEYAIYCDRHGRQAYLEDRAGIVRRILREK